MEKVQLQRYRQSQQPASFHYVAQCQYIEIQPRTWAIIQILAYTHFPNCLWHCVALQKRGASWFVCHTKHLDHQIQQDGTGRHVAHRNAYRVLAGKPKGNRPCGKIEQRCEENIKMDLTVTEQVGVGWIQVARDRDTGNRLSTWLSVFIFHTAGISRQAVKPVTFR
jgi:hypothetical protein